MPEKMQHRGPDPPQDRRLEGEIGKQGEGDTQDKQACLFAQKPPLTPVLPGQGGQGRQKGQPVKFLGVKGQAQKQAPQEEKGARVLLEAAGDEPGSEQEEPQGRDVPHDGAAAVDHVGAGQHQEDRQQGGRGAKEEAAAQEQGQEGEGQVQARHQAPLDQPYPQEPVGQGHRQDYGGAGADAVVQVGELVGALHGEGVAAVLHHVGGRLGEDGFVPPEFGVIGQVAEADPENHRGQQQGRPEVGRGGQAAPGRGLQAGARITIQGTSRFTGRNKKACTHYKAGPFLPGSKKSVTSPRYVYAVRRFSPAGPGPARPRCRPGCPGPAAAWGC